MGGVLADTDGTTRQRTPGVASIPILGNLFKRKLVTKNSLEILFFITPKIYRPDYFGRPITLTPVNGPRTTTVPQPVPLGNPQSNTPTPTELQQGDKPQPNTSVTPNVIGAPGPSSPSAGTAARPSAIGGQRPDR
jgi:Flp pilus assembly secretin CpaC